MCPVLLHINYTPMKLNNFSLLRKVDKTYSLSSRKSRFSKYYL